MLEHITPSEEANQWNIKLWMKTVITEHSTHVITTKALKTKNITWHFHRPEIQSWRPWQSVTSLEGQPSGHVSV